MECASPRSDKRIWLFIRRLSCLCQSPVSPYDDVRRPAALQPVFRITLFLFSLLPCEFSGMEIAIRVKFCFLTPKTVTRP